MPLSTTEPIPHQLYHYKIPKKSMPMLKEFQIADSWVKGDMVYTVGFHRLDLVRLGKHNAAGLREYFKNRLGREQMSQIYQCVLHGLNLGSLAVHL